VNYCVVPENIHTPRKVNRNSKGEGGFNSQFFLKETMEIKWNCRGGGEVHAKKG